MCDVFEVGRKPDSKRIKIISGFYLHGGECTNKDIVGEDGRKGIGSYRITHRQGNMRRNIRQSSDAVISAFPIE